MNILEFKGIIVRYFHPDKSMSKRRKHTNYNKKRVKYLVWDSFRDGTYIKSIHGDLWPKDGKKKYKLVK